MNIWSLIYRISWIALIILGVILLAAMFWPQIRHYRELQRKEAALAADIRMEEEILKHLKAQQERLKSDPRFVEKIAREELKLAKPGETIFKFAEDEPQSFRPKPR